MGLSEIKKQDKKEQYAVFIRELDPTILETASLIGFIEMWVREVQTDSEIWPGKRKILRTNLVPLQPDQMFVIIEYLSDAE